MIVFSEDGFLMENTLKLTFLCHVGHQGRMNFAECAVRWVTLPYTRRICLPDFFKGQIIAHNLLLICGRKCPFFLLPLYSPVNAQASSPRSKKDGT